MIKILPHSLASKSAKMLAASLGCQRIHPIPGKSKYKGTKEDIIYNYGCHTLLPFMQQNTGLLLNHPDAIKRASSKMDTFNVLSLAISKHITDGETVSVRVPRHTSSKQEAASWIEAGSMVYCRTLTRASQGKGIVIAKTKDQLVSAPLYVEGITDVKREYRAHVFCGEVIDITAKAHRNGEKPTNEEIRNLHNGWVFVREAVSIPDSVKTRLINSAVETCEMLGLDVAAVDLIRDNQGNVWVLEVNTAPGMEGTTLDKYVAALKKCEELHRENKGNKATPIWPTYDDEYPSIEEDEEDDDEQESLVSF